MAEDHTVIVLSPGNRTIYDTDPATGKILNQLQLDGAPTEAIFSYDERFIFVSVPEVGAIELINAKTFKETSRLVRPEFKRPAGYTGLIDVLSGTPNYKKLYVSYPGGLDVFDQQLLIYNPEYKQPEKKVALAGKDPQHFLVHGPSEKLYYSFRGDNQVAVIDTNTDSVVKMVAVKGGPSDVAFNFGGEAWITSEDGTVTIIDTKTDEVVKTIATGGKGGTRIVNAVDQRYIAVTHNDSDDVTFIQPRTKEILSTVKLPMKGPLSVRSLPTGHGGAVKGVYGAASGEGLWKYPFSDSFYVTGDSGLSIVNVEKKTAGAPQEIGKNNSNTLIHYMFPDAFTPPREATATRIMENDTYTLYNNAMANYDESPIHEHRTDMVGLHVAKGHTKIGCWDPACPARAVENNLDGRPFDYGQSVLGQFTGNQRGTLHQEEGISPQPREMMVFMQKNNYYRQIDPKKESDFKKLKGARLIADNSRAWMFDMVLIPGQPIHFPHIDSAVVYLSGGLVKETKDNVPEIDHRLFKEWDLDTSDRTMEALSNRVHMILIEFK